MLKTPVDISPWKLWESMGTGPQGKRGGKSDKSKKGEDRTHRPQGSIGLDSEGSERRGAVQGGERTRGLGKRAIEDRRRSKVESTCPRGQCGGAHTKKLTMISEITGKGDRKGPNGS